jgi:hypothetical protein
LRKAWDFVTPGTLARHREEACLASLFLKELSKVDG